MTIAKLRPFAALFGLAICTLACGQSATSYTAPAKWNNFYPTSLYAATQNRAGSDSFPTSYSDAPVAFEPVPSPVPMDGSILKSIGTQDESANVPSSESLMEPGEGVAADGVDVGEACREAASSAWPGGERLPLRPCFASFNLLFLTLANDTVIPVAGGLPGYTTDAVNPDTTVGFEAEIGRYIRGGRFGIGVGYMLWNPESAIAVRVGPAGSITPTMPAYRDVSIDINGAGVDTVDNYITGVGPGSGATAVRVSRDVFYQGIEANLYCFGLMGSSRVSYPGCNPPGCLGLGGRFDHGCYGYGGANGPLTRPSSGRIRVMASHGFRWFQIKDRLDFDYNIDGNPGFQGEDLYECYHIENNLFGYQLGSQLSYCLNACWSLNIGGKFGIYGNNAQRMHHLGSSTTAFRTGTSDLIHTESSDTSLATMGELDFGLGRRIRRAWTIRGGYRLYGITGVETSPNSITGTYSSLAASAAVDANDSIVLHGGYVGLDFNW